MDRSLQDLQDIIGALRKKSSSINISINVSSAGPEPGALLRDISFGGQFKRSAGGATFARCRPASFLLNSTLVQENLARGNILVMQLDSGSTYFLEGTERIIPV